MLACKQNTEGMGLRDVTMYQFLVRKQGPEVGGIFQDSEDVKIRSAGTR